MQDVTTNKLAEHALREQHRVLDKALEGRYIRSRWRSSCATPIPPTQRRVAELACAIARKMGWIISASRASAGGDDHDIGRSVFPAEILRQAVAVVAGGLQIVREHAVMGFNILKDGRFRGRSPEIAHQHPRAYRRFRLTRRGSGEAIYLEAR